MIECYNTDVWERDMILNSLILGVTFKEFMQRQNVIIGMALAIVGIACLLLSKTVSMAVTKTSKLDKTSKTFIAMQVAGLLLVLLGMILIAIRF